MLSVPGQASGKEVTARRRRRGELWKNQEMPGREATVSGISSVTCGRVLFSSCDIAPLLPSAPSAPYIVIMSTKLAVSDNIDLHRPLIMPSISSNTRMTSQPVHRSLGIPPRNSTYLRSDDSSVHGGFLEGMPHVRARLDAR